MPNPASAGLPHPAKYQTTASVVTDEVTGLVWQRESGGLHDFTSANEYCKNLQLEGLKWRLPWRIELVSIVDFTRAEATVDTAAFPGTSGNFWSGSAAAADPARRAWQVAFSSGATSMTSQTVTKNVRCVHGKEPAATPPTRYTFDGKPPDDTATDHGTQLVWQRTLSEDSFTFAAAQTYCEGLAVAGGGWRAPSVAELQTLLDDSKPVGPLSDAQAFPGAPGGAALFWSSSRAAGLATAAWFVNFGTGEASMTAAVIGNIVDMPGRVRCVRGQ